jgi:hypothetical protein
MIRPAIAQGTPKKLYKYRNPNEPYTRAGIAKRQQYLSSVKDFNDPLEFRFRVADLGGMTPDQWLAIYAQEHGYTDSDADIFDEDGGYANVVGATDPKTFADRARQAPKAFREWLEEEAGVLSLAEHPDNLLMWAHYADSHRGICLEFDTSVGPFRGAIQKINYDEAMPVFDPRYASQWAGIAEKVLLGKSPHWEYEREWRLVELHVKRRLSLTEDDDENERLMSYPPEALTGVITGCRFPESEFKALWELVTQSGAKPKAYRCVLSETDYRVNVEPR